MALSAEDRERLFANFRRIVAPKVVGGPDNNLVIEDSVERSRCCNAAVAKDEDERICSNCGATVGAPADKAD